MTRLTSLLLFLLITSASTAHAVNARFKTVVFGRYSDSITSFETFARQASQAGATHIVITAEDLPWAMWQMDTPGDPYPAWAVSNVGLLKVSIPAALEPFLPKGYSARVLAILRERCDVLRKLGLKAAFTTFEPQIRPERVYEVHPLWLGPQVHHPLSLPSNPTAA